MRIRNLYIVILVFATLLYGCSASKMYAKRGDKLAAAGLYDEAVYQYKLSLSQDITNIRGRVGLKICGQKILDTKIDQFVRAHTSDKLKEAVYYYLEALKINDEIKVYKVELNFPESYNDDFLQDKKEYSEQLYNDGSQFFKKKQYDLAQQQFDELYKLDPKYKDVAKMKIRSIVIPTFEQAQIEYNNTNYKTAYALYSKVADLDNSYQNVQMLMADAKEKATMVIAMLPFDAKYSDRDEADALLGKIISGLTQNQSALISIIDQANTEKILRDQKLNVNSMNAYGKIGLLLGAKYIITGKVISFEATKTPIRYMEKEGYESYKEKVFKKELNKTVEEINYRKVVYNEATGSFTMLCKFQYQLIETSTGKVIKSDVLTKEVRDDLHFITYNGIGENLYPNTIKTVLLPNLVNKIVNSGYNEIQGLLNARKQYRSEESLVNDVEDVISRAVCQQVFEVESNRK
jgi:tetratricopeptide (TPR) repeat protein